MALDAAILKLTAAELDEALRGARVEKIYMPSRDETVFTMRNAQGKLSLFMSARSGSARIHLTEEEFEYPATPPAFCMLLRKHLSGARITSVEMVPDDRIILVHFDAMNEMGDRVSPFISVEMMGRYSNIVLCSDDSRVLDAVKRIDESQSELRQLQPGEEFTLPPLPDKLPFLSSGDDEIASSVCLSRKTVPQALLSAVSGLSPLLCREAALGLEDTEAYHMDSGQKDILVRGLERIRGALNEPSLRDYNIVYDGARPVEFSFVSLRQYEGLKSVSFDSLSSLYDAFYGQRDRAERMKTRSQDLTRQIKQLIDRNRKKQQARREDLEATSKAEEKKLCGELLTANMHQFKRGDGSVTVLNYYDGSEKTISLDVMKDPSGNAQKYYKEYRKLRTAAQVLEKLLQDGEDELKYLEAVRYEISMARTEEEFLDIRRELKDAGYLKGSRIKERSKRKSDPFLHYRSSTGMEITVGRNNAANERLSLKIAGPKDMWFHVKDAAGSHVVLKTDGVKPDDVSLTEACEIAALNSEMENGVLVPVDYTEARRVRKLNGGRTGMVIYTEQKTAYVTADRNKLEKLRVTK